MILEFWGEVQECAVLAHIPPVILKQVVGIHMSSIPPPRVKNPGQDYRKHSGTSAGLGGRSNLPGVCPAPTAESNNADPAAVTLSWRAGNLHQHMLLCGPIDKPHTAQVSSV